MVISSLIRKNKRFVKNDNKQIIKPLRVTNQLAPSQDMIRHFIKEHPACVISDIYKGFPDLDEANIRKLIRKMVEGRRIKQHFTID